MQKRDNVSFGGIIYGKLRKIFAEKDSEGVIETVYEVMNSEEYKASEEELRRIVMRKRGREKALIHLIMLKMIMLIYIMRIAMQMPSITVRIMMLLIILIMQVIKSRHLALMKAIY